MTETVLACLCLVAALIPAVLFSRNLKLYLPSQHVPSLTPRISVLIPARNEEQSIGAAVLSALASEKVEVEVLVLDDQSSDATAAVVRKIAERDSRVRVFAAPELPAGWCGKQHACHILSQQARYGLLAFLDADVRLSSLGLARAAGFLELSQSDLVSGVPRQDTLTFAEKLLIPLIHFILLGFLPLDRMRSGDDAAFVAGCGQFFLVRRGAYISSGGHAAIRQTLHDGLKLPRAFRRAGFKTDLCDATELAACRMYCGLGQVWNGLAKNAVEALASPRLIVPCTLILLMGQVLPAVLVGFAACGRLSPLAAAAAVAALLFSYAPRLLAASRFRQSWLGALLHPLGVALFLAIQWYALLRWALGQPASWRGRRYAADVASP